jgi:hypothetical protein
MTAVPEMVEELHHELTPSGIIGQLSAVVERQLEAARSLDVASLNEATAQRQDLLFHLRIATQEARQANAGRPVNLGTEAQLELRRIAALDRRLQIVLDSVNTTLGAVLNKGATTTYGLDGRIKR